MEINPTDEQKSKIHRTT
ncbi:MAG: hypothetical protein E6537_09875 [Clostridium perfringens]|nr:hypothetical protein [Clostridium perfringens]